MIKNNFLLKGLFAALVVASPLAGAEQYPAPFEPEVIYRDPDLIAKHGEAAPASAPAATEQSQSKAQSLYPAAFEPEVLYRDADLIAKHAAKPAQPAARAVTGAAAPAAPAVVTSAKSENPLVENYPVALVVLALAGFVVWNTKRGASEVQAAPQQAAGVAAQAQAGAAQETGVARYLKSLPAAAVASETGVAKYLKSLPVAAAAAVTAAAETGVAKYLKALPAAAPKAAEGETGVAKYLKNLGA